MDLQPTVLENTQGLGAWTANVHQQATLARVGFPKKTKKSVHVKKSVLKRERYGRKSAVVATNKILQQSSSKPNERESPAKANNSCIKK